MLKDAGLSLCREHNIAGLVGSLSPAFVSHLLMAVPKKPQRRSSLGRGQAHRLPWQPHTRDARKKQMPTPPLKQNWR